MKEEIKNLQQENERIRNEIKEIMFINNFDTKEKDELWTKILNLIDNEIEQEKYCNQ